MDALFFVPRSEMNGGGKQMAGTKHEHFYGIESEQFTFYKVPKQLFVDEEFWNVSAEAKLDRKSVV